jgi:hypothetical protein
MSRLKWVGAVTVGLLLLCGGDKAEFEEFASKEGRFKVQMPGTPEEKTQTVAGVTLNLFLLEETDGGYAVAYADLPIAADEKVEAIQKRLDGARDGMLRNINATLVRESKITLKGKYQGREIEANLPDKKGLLRARLYVVNKRLYQVMVVGTTDYVRAESATKFLGSLVVTP